MIVYTGNGKGKTSACIGQTLRALGNGMNVAFAQFIKKNGVAGEQGELKKLLGSRFRAGGLGFCGASAERHLHRKSAQTLLDWARQQDAQMLILDEAIYALNYGLVDYDDLASFFSRAGSFESHLVLSGRDAPDRILAAADIVTEMVERKHHYCDGVTALTGIEF